MILELLACVVLAAVLAAWVALVPAPALDGRAVLGLLLATVALRLAAAIEGGQR